MREETALELSRGVVVRGSGYDLVMNSDPPPVTADELDQMTPDERRDEFRRRIITDPSELNEALRAKIRATSERLAEERRRVG